MVARYLLPALVLVVSSTAVVAQSPDSLAEPSPVIVRSGQQTFPTLRSRSIPSGDESVIEADDAPTNQLAIPAVTVTSSLAVVLGLFAAMVWLTRKFGSRSIAPGAIPREVMESLGTTAIDARTRVTMLRCGGRIIVLAQTPTEVRAISEITDPEEVRHLTATCLGDSKREFAIALKSIESEPVAPGFAADSEMPRQRGRLFATA